MINIVIPMKEPLTSKQRLSPVFNQKKRHDFALELFESSLRFFQKYFAEYHLLVVTNSQTIVRISKFHGVSVLLELDDGLSNAINEAAQWSKQHKFTGQLVIPADIAQLNINEINQLLQHDITQPGVVLCPSQDNGTNALLTCPPDAIDFCYGRNSADAHQKKAAEANIQFTRLYFEKLAIDIDFPVDLKYVMFTPKINQILQRIS